MPNTREDDLLLASDVATKCAVGAADVTPGASDLARTSRAIYIGTAGDLECEFIDGSLATFTNLPIGVYPFALRKVTAGTTAGGIIALF